MRLPNKELTEQELLEQMEAQQTAIKKARDAQEQTLLISHLRSKYIHYAGKEPDGRWGVETLREEINKLK